MRFPLAINTRLVDCLLPNKLNGPRCHVFLRDDFPTRLVRCHCEFNRRCVCNTTELQRHFYRYVRAHWDASKKSLPGRYREAPWRPTVRFTWPYPQHAALRKRDRPPKMLKRVVGENHKGKGRGILGKCTSNVPCMDLRGRQPNPSTLNNGTKHNCAPRLGRELRLLTLGNIWPAASSGTIPTYKNTGVTWPGIEPGSSWWEVSILASQPPRPLTLLQGRANRWWRGKAWSSLACRNIMCRDMVTDPYLAECSGHVEVSVLAAGHALLDELTWRIVRCRYHTECSGHVESAIIRRSCRTGRADWACRIRRTAPSTRQTADHGRPQSPRCEAQRPAHRSVRQSVAMETPGGEGSTSARRWGCCHLPGAPRSECFALPAVHFPPRKRYAHFRPHTLDDIQTCVMAIPAHRMKIKPTEPYEVEKMLAVWDGLPVLYIGGVFDELHASRTLQVWAPRGCLPLSCTSLLPRDASQPGTTRVPFQDFRISIDGGVVASALASHPGDTGSIPGGLAPGFLHVGIVLDDAACRRAFSGHSRFPRPCIPAPLHPRVSLQVMFRDDGHLRTSGAKLPETERGKGETERDSERGRGDRNRERERARQNLVCSLPGAGIAFHRKVLQGSHNGNEVLVENMYELVHLGPSYFT
ncbi:hypothetical protein PR048_006664 [Dryococelus australis]|uniref:Uncharacterized protein n=1 Tax=Dryococelus australis TaxID=614101 RepID=A0ABQ9ICT9_9NEOP|nr:hypothetical protein PR048_006664 [Dryococelus australis]